MGFKNNDCYMLNEFPENIKYFKEEKFCQTLKIPRSNPDIENIYDVFVNPRIIDMKLVKTNTGLSNEGQQLTGYKLIVELCIEQKITYVAEEPTQSIFAVHYESLKSMYIVLPEYINGKNVSDLFKSSRINVTPLLEHTYTRKLDLKTFNVCMLLFLDVQIC